MARWVNESYWAKDVETERKAENRQWLWDETKSLIKHIAKGVLQVGAFIGTFLGIIFWFAWIVGDGDQVRWLRVLTIIPVSGVGLGIFRWLDEG